MPYNKEIVSCRAIDYCGVTSPYVFERLKYRWAGCAVAMNSGPLGKYLLPFPRLSLPRCLPLPF